MYLFILYVNRYNIIMVKSIKSTNYFLVAFLILVFLAGIFVIFWTGYQSTNIQKVAQVVVPTLTIPIVNVSGPGTGPSPGPADVIIDTTINNDILPDDEDNIQNLPPQDPTECPDLLIRRGNELLLYNTKMPEVPGQNPIHFNTLDDYIYYIKVQRYKYNKYCPVLFLQQETNAQGQDVYRMRPGPFNPQGGLPTTAEMSQAQMASIGQYFKGQNQQVGVLGKFANPIYVEGPSPFNQSGPNAISLGSTGSPLTQLTQQTVLPHPKQVPYVDANRENNPYNQGYYGFDPYGQYIGKYTVLDQIHQSTQIQNPSTGLSNNPMDPNWGGIVFNSPKIVTDKTDFTPYDKGFSPLTMDKLQGVSLSPAPAPASSASSDKGDPKDNAMSDAWSGADYTQKSVDAGNYASDNLALRVA